MATTSMINLTMDHVADVLQQYLISEVTDPDDIDTIAAVARCGKLQDDPTQGTGINILLHPNHPFDNDWKHVLAKPDDIGVGVSAQDFPIYEIGGGALWLRRYTISLSVYDINEEVRDTTRNIAQVVLSRVEYTLRQHLNLASLGQDSFSETSINVVVRDSYMREGGGPGTFIWKGEVRFQTLNHIESCF